MSAVIAEPSDRPWPSADEAMVQVIAARYGAVAAELRRVQSVLTGPLIPESGWSGSARLAFDETARARSTLIGPIATRYEASAVVLRRYAGELQLLRPRLAAARMRLLAIGATDGPDLLASLRAEWQHTRAPRPIEGAPCSSMSARAPPSSPNAFNETAAHLVLKFPRPRLG